MWLLQHFQDEISELVAKLNIHVAIGAGMVYGYHVGGVGKKWEYLIDGPVMQQVRLADADAGAGEVALSYEAHELVKGIDMRKDKLQSGNYLLRTYLGPTKVPKFIRPWETVTNKHMQTVLADCLMQYVAHPVVEQVQAGLATVAQHRTISTAFCRLIGIDYESKEGEIAVMELGAITSQVQLILGKHDGTLTRVISDDKGTSMLIAFERADCAVQAALEMVQSITSIPTPEGQDPFKTAIGITTGTVWIGCVGGRIRSEYTMHGSHVNFAARLMTCKLIKEIGGILCDKATLDLCPDISFSITEPMPFKGFIEKLVSYVPYLPGEDERPLKERLADRFMLHRSLTEEWIDELTQLRTQTPPDHSHGTRSRPRSTSELGRKGRGVVVVLQTDVASQWNIAALFEAIETINIDMRLEEMERCHIPIIPEMTSEIDQVTDDEDRTEQRRKETIRRHIRNNKELSRLIEDPNSLRSMVYVIERADALSADGWKMLYKLCASKSYLRQREVHCIIVITLEPTPMDESGMAMGGMGATYSSGSEALTAANQRSIGGGRSADPENWLAIKKFIAYKQIPWYFKSPQQAAIDEEAAAQAHAQAGGGGGGGGATVKEVGDGVGDDWELDPMLPPIPGAGSGMPSSTPQGKGKAPPALPPSSSRAKRTRSVITAGADRCEAKPCQAANATHHTTL